SGWTSRTATSGSTSAPRCTPGGHEHGTVPRPIPAIRARPVVADGAAHDADLVRALPADRGGLLVDVPRPLLLPRLRDLAGAHGRGRDAAHAGDRQQRRPGTGPARDAGDHPL